MESSKITVLSDISFIRIPVIYITLRYHDQYDMRPPDRFPVGRRLNKKLSVLPLVTQISLSAVTGRSNCLD